MAEKQVTYQNHSKKSVVAARVLVFGLVCIAVLLYLIFEFNSLDRRFARVKYGSELSEVKQVMGRSSNSSWLPVKYVYIWHEKKVYFQWGYPFYHYRLSKQFIVELSPQGKVVKKRVHFE